MACPSGCLNGGGQIKPAQGQTPQQLLEQLEQFYTHQDVTPRQPQVGHPATAVLDQVGCIALCLLLLMMYDV